VRCDNGDGTCTRTVGPVDDTIHQGVVLTHLEDTRKLSNKGCGSNVQAVEMETRRGRATAAFMICSPRQVADGDRLDAATEHTPSCATAVLVAKSNLTSSRKGDHDHFSRLATATNHLTLLPFSISTHIRNSRFLLDPILPGVIFLGSESPP
jgi:hypothetical protein